jgi:hypothetical protein
MKDTWSNIPAAGQKSPAQGNSSGGISLAQIIVSNAAVCAINFVMKDHICHIIISDPLNF